MRVKQYNYILKNRYFKSGRLIKVKTWSNGESMLCIDGRNWYEPKDKTDRHMVDHVVKHGDLVKDKSVDLSGHVL